MRKPSGKPTIYMDYASLTPVDARVSKEVADFSKTNSANPSSIYMSGVRAKKALGDARVASAQFVHAHADEIIFTGSGTEANNIAILGAVENFLQKNKKAGKSYKDIHIIVSEIEHASVLEAARALEAKGVQLDVVPVTSAGIIDVQVFKKMLRPTTLIVSIMMVNNEIGTIQPVAEVVKIVRDFKKANNFSYPLVHTDACQALMYMGINLEKLGVDLLTADSHKVYGPRGVGMLYIRRSASSFISPIMYGGGQENGMRPGTEHVAGIVGFAKALEIAKKENEPGKNRETETDRVIKLRDYCIEEIEKTIPNVIINGDRGQRIANNVNISIPEIDHEFLLLQLDNRGVQCSTKSSCLRDEDESYVIAALRKGANNESGLRQSLRFTFGRMTTKKDIDFLVKNIDECLHL